MEARTASGIICCLILAGIVGCMPVAADNVFQPVPDSRGDYGYYLVNSNPAGADVVFDGTYVGESPVTIPVFSSSSPGHSIEVSKIGYITWTQSYSLNPAPGQTIQVYAPLQLSELTGSISVTSSPNGALVSLDGQKGQMAPWIYENIPVGIHMVQAYLSGYSPYTTQVNVEPGQMSFAQATLIPLGSVGTIQVISTPGGADLYVDEVYKGKTSLTVGNLASGNHTVLLKLFGYRDLTGNTTIVQGQTVILSLTLVPNTQPSAGTITVSSVPAGAGIYLDGAFKGLTRTDEAVTFTGIVPGEHEVSLKSANYQEYSKKFDVTAGSITDITEVLTPAPGPGPGLPGTIDVNSQPSGASVFIDNTFSGATPVTVQSVSSGPHTILIRINGYEDYNTSIILKPGQSALVSAALAPFPAAEPTTVPLPAAGIIIVELFLMMVSVRFMMR